MTFDIDFWPVLIDILAAAAVCGLVTSAIVFVALRRGWPPVSEWEAVVAAGDFTDALKAVTPFTSTDVDHLDRIRCTVTQAVTFAAATDGYGAALAIASTLSTSADPVDEFELNSSQARGVVALFTPTKEQRVLGSELRIEVDVEHVIVTDVSGFIEGQQLILPRVPSDEMTPAVLAQVFAGRIHKRPTPDPEVPPVYSPAALARLVAAAKVYKADLVLEHTAASRDSSGWTFARAGDSFLGLVAGRSRTNDEPPQRVATQDWRARLTRLALVPDLPAED